MFHLSNDQKQYHGQNSQDHQFHQPNKPTKREKYNKHQKCNKNWSFKVKVAKTHAKICFNLKQIFAWVFATLTITTLTIT